MLTFPPVSKEVAGLGEGTEALRAGVGPLLGVCPSVFGGGRAVPERDRAELARVGRVAGVLAVMNPESAGRREDTATLPAHELHLFVNVPHMPPEGLAVREGPWTRLARVSPVVDLFGVDFLLTFFEALTCPGKHALEVERQLRRRQRPFSVRLERHVVVDLQTKRVRRFELCDRRFTLQGSHN